MKNWRVVDKLLKVIEGSMKYSTDDYCNNSGNVNDEDFTPPTLKVLSNLDDSTDIE